MQQQAGLGKPDLAVSVATFEQDPQQVQLDSPDVSCCVKAAVQNANPSDESAELTSLPSSQSPVPALKVLSMDGGHMLCVPACVWRQLHVTVNF